VIATLVRLVCPWARTQVPARAHARQLKYTGREGQRGTRSQAWGGAGSLGLWGPHNPHSSAARLPLWHAQSPVAPPGPLRSCEEGLLPLRIRSGTTDESGCRFCEEGQPTLGLAGLKVSRTRRAEGT